MNFPPFVPLLSPVLPWFYLKENIRNFDRNLGEFLKAKIIQSASGSLQQMCCFPPFKL